MPEVDTKPSPDEDGLRLPSGVGARSWGLRALLVGLAAIGPFSLNVFKPCLPWIKATFDAPITTVQLALSLSILAAAIATAAAGPLADVVGRRPVAIACVHVYVIACLVGTVAPSVEVVIGARIVQAAASSVAMTVARALVHDGRTHVRRTIARITILAVVAVLLAPALGGVIIDRLGWRAVFGLTAALGLLLVWPVHRTLPRTRRDPEAPPSTDASARDASARAPSTWSQRLLRLLTSPVFAGYAIQSSLHFAVFFAFTSAATYLMVDAMGRDSTEYGLWFLFLALWVMGGLACAERLAGRLPSGRVAWMGSVLVLVGCAISAWLLASEAPLTPVRLFLPGIVSGFGVGLALPSTNAGVMEVVPELAGTASGLLGFLQFATAAAFAQAVVQDEPHTATVLAGLVLVGGVGSVAFGLLSIRHGAPERPST
ncbi:MFS transporter [Paraliomyxa miuraensis]|uniref:MFS transporter n=1 Tax=Paraliomyxa miuraensis TaxID=376150 RepID=UPI00225ACABD|nr:MFS transporter [Paraliomyxa miuraensis]MCX4242731.1 MFS transporter [Paraliomyxa miuraensis]